MQTFHPEVSNWAFMTMLFGTVLGTAVQSIAAWTDRNSRTDLKKRIGELRKTEPLSAKTVTESSVRKSERYSSECESLSDLGNSLRCGISTLVLFLGVFPMAFGLMESHGFPILASYLTAFCAVAVLQTAFSIPFSWLGTFGTERRWGFNKSGTSTFATDALKGLAFTLVVGSALVSASHLVLRWMGTPTLWKGLLLSLSIVVLSVAAESLLIPFISAFNTLKPLKNPSLKMRVSAIFRRAGMKPLPVLVVDDSRRTSKANAFFCGFWKFRRIVISDNLLKGYSDDEISAIVAHEVSHDVRHHLLGERVLRHLSTFLTATSAYLLSSGPTVFRAFGFSAPWETTPPERILLGTVLSSAVISSVSWIAAPLFNSMSRRHEYEADEGAFLLTKPKKGNSSKATHVSSALLKLHAKSLSIPFTSRFNEFLNFDHPSLENRIRHLANLRDSLRKSRSRCGKRRIAKTEGRRKS